MINVGRRAAVEVEGRGGRPRGAGRDRSQWAGAEGGGRGPSPPSPPPPARVCAQDARQAAQVPAAEHACQKPERCVPTASAGCRMRMIQRAPWHDDSDPPECGQWRQRAARARASRMRQARRGCRQAGDAEGSPQPESRRQQRCRAVPEDPAPTPPTRPIPADSCSATASVAPGPSGMRAAGRSSRAACPRGGQCKRFCRAV